MTNQLLAVAPVVVVLAFVAPRSADACSRFATSSINGFSTLPRDGQGAPRNTKVWHVVRGAQPTAVGLFDAAGTEIPGTVTRLPVTDEPQESLLVLTPMSLLPVGAEVEFRINGERVVRFTVVDEQDAMAPPAFAPTATAAAGGAPGSSPCGAPSSTTIRLGLTPELALAAPAGTSWPPSSLVGAAFGTDLVLSALPEGPARLALFHVDLAGNVAGPMEVSFTVPAPERGCTAAGGSALMLPALLLALRRRRG
jgi:hypothetical protein